MKALGAELIIKTLLRAHTSVQPRETLTESAQYALSLHCY